MNDTNDTELVVFGFVSSVNFTFSGRLPSDTVLPILQRTLWGKTRVRYTKASAGLALASLEYRWVSSEKPTRELLFVVLFL